MIDGPEPCWYCAHHHEPDTVCGYAWPFGHPFYGDPCECKWGRAEETKDLQDLHDEEEGTA